MPDDVETIEVKPKLDIFGILMIASAVALLVAAIVGIVYCRSIGSEDIPKASPPRTAPDAP